MLVDPNVLISALLAGSDANKSIAQTFRLGGLGQFDILIAEESIVEVRSKLTTKPWLVRRIPVAVGEAFLARTTALATILPALAYLPPRRCRDRDDDYLLEQAVRFDARILLTGDDDLSAMEQPPGALLIMNARTFLDRLPALLALELL